MSAFDLFSIVAIAAGVIFIFFMASLHDEETRIERLSNPCSPGYVEVYMWSGGGSSGALKRVCINGYEPK